MVQRYDFVPKKITAVGPKGCLKRKTTLNIVVNDFAIVYEQTECFFLLRQQLSHLHCNRQ